MANRSTPSGWSSRSWAALALLGSLGWPGLLGATSANLSGIGPRTLALSGAGATLDSGYEATLTNPAALQFVERPALSLGYSVSYFALETQRGELPAQRFAAKSLSVGWLGLALPLRLADETLVLGVAAASPESLVAQAELPHPETPDFPLLLSRSRATDFDLSLGMRPWRFLAFGAGLRALASLRGTVEVEQGDQATTTTVDATLEPSLAPLLGASAFLGRSGALALVFRGALRADFDLRLAPVDLGATELPALHLAGVAHYDPLSLHAEYSRDFGPVTGLVAAAYLRWRDFPTRLARTVDCPPERPGCLALGSAPSALKDTWNLHAAVRYRFAWSAHALGTARASYALVPSPVPEQTGSENLLDADRHVLGFGYGLQLLSPLALELNWGLQAQLLSERLNRKSPDVPAENLGAPSLAARGFVLSTGLSLQVNLQ